MQKHVKRGLRPSIRTQVLRVLWDGPNTINGVAREVGNLRYASELVNGGNHYCACTHETARRHLDELVSEGRVSRYFSGEHTMYRLDLKVH